MTQVLYLAPGTRRAGPRNPGTRRHGPRNPGTRRHGSRNPSDVPDPGIQESRNPGTQEPRNPTSRNVVSKKNTNASPAPTLHSLNDTMRVFTYECSHMSVRIWLFTYDCSHMTVHIWPFTYDHCDVHTWVICCFLDLYFLKLLSVYDTICDHMWCSYVSVGIWVGLVSVYDCRYMIICGCSYVMHICESKMNHTGSVYDVHMWT